MALATAGSLHPAGVFDLQRRRRILEQLLQRRGHPQPGRPSGRAGGRPVLHQLRPGLLPDSPWLCSTWPIPCSASRRFACAPTSCWLSAGLIFSLSALFAFFRDSTDFLGQQVSTGGAVGVITDPGSQGHRRRHRGNASAAAAAGGLDHDPVKFSFVLFAGWWLENFKHKWAAWQERRAHQSEEHQREKARQEGMPAAACVYRTAHQAGRRAGTALQCLQEGKG